jgi:hypothetical protein
VAEKKKKVTLDEAVAVLVKHANVSGAPDDVEVLQRYTEQEEEAKKEQEES